MRNFSIASAAFALAALTACADGQPVEGVTGTSTCTGCHGGQDNQSGAPPFDTVGAATSDAVGAHTAHVDAGVECIACHLDPRVVTTTTTHGNGLSDVDFSDVVDPSGLATYSRSTLACSNVYCHAPVTGDPGTLPAPAWTAPPGTITGCAACHPAPPTNHGGVVISCSGCHPGDTHVNGSVELAAHPAGWTTPNADGVTPHGLDANYVTTATGLAGCRACHGSNLDNPVVAGIASCDSCHQPFSLPGTAATDWRTDCTFCHGDRARLADGLDAGGVTTLAFAPPRDASGATAGTQVGVHRSHLYATAAISARVACTSCHTVPTSIAHVNGAAPVAPRDPLGAPSGSYSRPGAAAGTCATYCHGAFTGGNNANTPSWTGAGTQTCTSCHATSPATGRHPSVFGSHSFMATNCTFCHFDVATNEAPSAIKPAGRPLHVNGGPNVTLSNFQGTAASGAYNPTAKSCAPGCHGVETW